MQTLPLARYEFTVRALTPLRLPDYAGSTLRGAFGLALRQSSCMTQEPRCGGCPVADTCVYANIFEPHEIPRNNVAFSGISEIPVPFIVEPPPWGSKMLQPGDTFSFTQLLMGEALHHLPMIINAWRIALHRGIGKQKGKAELMTVEWLAPHGKQRVHDSGTHQVIPHQPVIDIPEYTAPENIHLNFVTPLRMQSNGRIIGAAELTPGLFLRQLLRRMTLLGQLHMGQPAPDGSMVRDLLALADGIGHEKRLKWREATRFSSRQQQKTPLSGLTGHWLLKDVPAELLGILHVGQWLHAGKGAVFGLGQYEISPTPWNPTNIRNADHVA